MKQQYRKIEYGCRCAAGKLCDKLLIQDFGDGDILVDLQRKKKYYGVVLNKKDVIKLIKWLSQNLKEK
jgi:hypothetical protein